MKQMTFDEARQYLGSALTFGIKLGLDRMRSLMDLLGHPEKQLRCIHIAGTNGKGSVAAYCAAILASAHQRVGIYTSPYLVRLTERVRVIDGPDALRGLIDDETTGEISERDFARLISRVRQAVETMQAQGQEHPTEFELLTAVAFLYYREKECDVVVLETGLGGRLDATNVIERPLACIITALGYDHMDRLGSSLADIAKEKAGIIKPKRPVYLYHPQDIDIEPSETSAAKQVIFNQCQMKEAPLKVVKKEEVRVHSYDWSGQVFEDQVSGIVARTSLLNVVQPMNATLAIRMCLDLKLADEDQIREGIEATRWPARMERVGENPPILIDGAHNPQCCRALADSLNRFFADQPVIFLAGVLADKDYVDMMNIMLKDTAYHPRAFICVRPENDRALSAECLAGVVRDIWKQLPEPTASRYNEAVRIETSPVEGAKWAFNYARRHQIALCAFGSLYLVGHIRQILKPRED
jgi:dihydrofolate synthase / folylpolyglutamate synthase